MPPEEKQNGWSKYEEKVFYQLDQLAAGLEKVEGKVDRLRDDVLVLKTKAWAFGIIGGAIVTALFQIILNLAK